MEDEYYESLKQCGLRYLAKCINLINDNNYWGWANQKMTFDQAVTLLEFIKEFRAGIINKLPLMKLNRWLGYIQGTLIQWEVTTVEIEREWTRPLFRHLDYNQGAINSAVECNPDMVEVTGSNPVLRTT